MAHQMFRDVVEPFAGANRPRKYTVVLSMASHAIGAAALVIAPLAATGSDLIPVPSTMLAFAAPPQIPAIPSVQPAAPVRPVDTTRAPDAVPVEAPNGVAPEEPRPAAPESLVGFVYAADVVPQGQLFVEAMPPTAVARPEMPIRPGGDIKPPTKIKDVAPIYPAVAMAAHVEGFVIVEATISATGKVQDARVLRAHPLLEVAALDAVRQWEYTPTLLNGKPVPVLITVTVRFTLRPH